MDQFHLTSFFFSSCDCQNLQVKFLKCLILFTKYKKLTKCQSELAIVFNDCYEIISIERMTIINCHYNIVICFDHLHIQRVQAYKGWHYWYLTMTVLRIKLKFTCFEYVITISLCVCLSQIPSFFSQQLLVCIKCVIILTVNRFQFEQKLRDGEAGEESHLPRTVFAFG